MPLKTYRALSGQSLYDLAIAIYKDVRGVAPILQFNDIDANLVDYVGTDITYDDSITFEKLALAVTAPAPPPPTVVALDRQTIYDAACSIYGDIRKLALIVAQVPSPNDDMPRGMVLSVEKADNPIAGRFSIATAPSDRVYDIVASIALNDTYSVVLTFDVDEGHFAVGDQTFMSEFYPEMATWSYTEAAEFDNQLRFVFVHNDGTELGEYIGPFDIYDFDPGGDEDSVLIRRIWAKITMI